jgi:general secretion pathway protein C
MTLRDGRETGKRPTPPPTAPPVATVTQITPVPQRLADPGIVSERGLFGGAGDDTPPSTQEVATDSPPLADEGLGLKLLGTVVADEPGGSFAIIEGQGVRGQKVYREGERAGQALIRTIARNWVLVNAGGGDVVLTMNLARAAEDSFTEASGNGSAVAAGAAQSAMRQASMVHAEYASLIQQIHVRPYLETGRPGGILVYGIEPGSVFAAMGLEDGDVIRGLNGKAVTSPQQTVDLYRAVKEGGELILQVSRGESIEELRFEGEGRVSRPKRGPRTGTS